MSIRPQRIRLSRKSGFKLQHQSRLLNGLPAINCARPGKFGNPFNANGGIDKTELLRHEIAVSAFRDWITSDDPDCFDAEHKCIKENLESLRNHNLACYCKAELPCHCDVYLEILYGPAETHPYSGLRLVVDNDKPETEPVRVYDYSAILAHLRAPRLPLDATEGKDMIPPHAMDLEAADCVESLRNDVNALAGQFHENDVAFVGLLNSIIETLNIIRFFNTNGKTENVDRVAANMIRVIEADVL